MIAANVAIWLLVTLTVLGAWFFFRRWSLTRPPLGTVNLGDVGFTLASIVAMPFLYLWLPGWVAGLLLAVTTLSLLWFLVEPVTPSPLARWGLAGGLVAADVLLAWQPGTSSTAFLLVNDAVIILVAIGVSVLWAQGGLRARDLAILAGAITLYDLVATGFLPLTTEMIDRLAGMPFLPMAAWPVGNGEWVGIGLGDLLMAAVAPLIFRKAFGKQAGMVAIEVALGIELGGLRQGRTRLSDRQNARAEGRGEQRLGVDGEHAHRIRRQQRERIGVNRGGRELLARAGLHDHVLLLGASRQRQRD